MRALRVPSLLAIVMGAPLACSNGTAATSTPNPIEAPDASAEASTNACAVGLALSATGACEPLLPKADCAPGSMPMLGSETCAAVGWTACPKGFVFDPAKGSCVDAIPKAPCAGNTMESIDAPGCVPIDSCGAFPPAEAKLFVSAAYGPSQIDSTHFATLRAAVAAAPAGSTIAVDDGTYSENVVIGKPLVIVGHCSSNVKLSGAGGLAQAFFVRANFSLTGVTIEGYSDAVVVDRGPVHLQNVLLQNNAHAALYLQGDKTTLSSVVVRGTREAKPGDLTVGALALNGAQLTINRSVFTANVGAALGATGAGSAIQASNSIFRNSVARSDGIGGSAMRADKGSSFDFRDSIVASNEGSALRADGKGTSAKLSGVVVRDTVADTRMGAATVGLSVGNGASAEVTESGFLDTPAAAIVVGVGSQATLTKVSVSGTNEVPGTPTDALVAVLGSTVTITQSAFLHNQGITVAADGSDVTMTGSLVTDTLPVGKMNLAFGASTARQGHLTVKSSAFVRNAGVSLSVLMPGSTLTLDRVLVDRTMAPYGHGVFVATSGTLIADTLVARNNLGAAILLSSAGGLVRSSFILDNGIGVQAQMGTTFEEVATPTEVSPLSVRVSSDTVFRRNMTKVGSDVVPLPTNEQ